MNIIMETMKKRIQPLLDLCYEANIQIEEVEKLGYTVGLKGSFLSQFTKNFAYNDQKQISPDKLKKTLAKITKELEQLANEDYYVLLTKERPNGSIRLFIENVKIVLLNRDYTQKYFSG